MASVREIQKALSDAGFYKGAIDGVIGWRHKAAVKAFQVANGLAADGIVGPITLSALFPEKIDRDEGAPIQPPDDDGGPPWPKQKDAMKFYGAVGMHQTKLVLPFPMKLAWDLDVSIHSFSIHEKVHNSASRCFDKIAAAYTAMERAEIGLDLFGGCLNVRRMRGGTSYSMHSWGIAIDFDPERNRLTWGKDKARLAKPDCEEFWRIWEDEGWVSLGRARGFDFMHAQAARL